MATATEKILQESIKTRLLLRLAARRFWTTRVLKLIQGVVSSMCTEFSNRSDNALPYADTIQVARF